MKTNCPQCGRAIQGLLPLPITFCPSCGHHFNEENEMANMIPAEDLTPQKPWHPSDEIRTITGLASAEPSPQARRAAEEIAERVLGGVFIYNNEGLNELAEIVERETGIGEAVKLIERFVDAANADNRGTELWNEARAFLANHQK